MTPAIVFNQRYREMKRLGEGGFGETFLAQDEEQDCLCVVKRLKPPDSPSLYPIIQRGFKREIEILKKLEHEQIPRFYDAFEEAGQFHLVQEFVAGRTLEQKLKTEGMQDEAEVRKFLGDLLPVLQYIHSRKIIHRDIKPANIILRESDSKPVLIDFGAVKEVMTALGTTTVIGTPGYISSEQARGYPAYASDLYSLGITAIEMLTGLHALIIVSINPETQEPRWREQASTVSEHLADILTKATKLDAADRFISTQAMLDALSADPAVSSPTLTSPTLTSPTSTSLPSRNSATRLSPKSQRRLLIGGATVAIIAIVGTASSSVYMSPERRALANIRSLYEQARYEECITQTAAFLASAPSQSATTQANNFSRDCSLSHYIQNEVPQRQAASYSTFSEQLAQLEPIQVEVNGDRVNISYGISSDPNFRSDDPQKQKELTALFMQMLRGNPDYNLEPRYDDFTHLTTSPKTGGQRAVLSTEEWKAYIQGEQDIQSLETLLSQIELTDR